MPILARLRRSPQLWRLAGVRASGLLGDGMFQSALGGAILFSPERATDTAAIAGGFAVLLLPYSLLGPFFGALIDRWDRRAVLVRAGLLRSAAMVLVAALLVTGAPTPVVLVAALASIGVSRFVLASMSASLPHVVPQSWMIASNSALTTVGSAVTAMGAGLSVSLIAVAGAGDHAAALACAVGAAASLVGALLAARFPRRSLGPDTPARGTPVREVLHGLTSGLAAVAANPPVRRALSALGTHRVVFGFNTLVLLLILRASDGSSSVVPGGFAGFGFAVGATATGMLIAAVVVPWAATRVPRHVLIAHALTLAVIVQLTLIVTLKPDLIVLGALLLGIVGQTVKLCADASMQLDLDDTHRGRVFSLQDTLFNVAFVGAVATGALMVDNAGSGSTTVVLVGAAVYTLGLITVLLGRPATPTTPTVPLLPPPVRVDHDRGATP